jgi:pantoate--beta-alanine ligase
MEILRTVRELQHFMFNKRSKTQNLGFVPTMGALHEGHFSLVKRSREENEITIVSIFVNPTQFNENSDYVNYPRNEEADLNLLKQFAPDAVFLPKAEEMYKEGEQMLDFDLHGLDQVLEGKFRSGHFQGVITVVDKFFNLIKPDKAYFGLKDFQQLVIIKLMASQRYPGLEIVACPTVREGNGLAMSSRNQRLDNAEQKQALVISQSLFFLRNNWRKAPYEALLQKAIQLISGPDVQLEYLEIVDPLTLNTLSDFPQSDCVACVAARIGDIRLIDNIVLSAAD